MFLFLMSLSALCMFPLGLLPAFALYSFVFCASKGLDFHFAPSDFDFLSGSRLSLHTVSFGVSGY